LNGYVKLLNLIKLLFNDEIKVVKWRIEIMICCELVDSLVLIAKAHSQ